MSDELVLTERDGTIVVPAATLARIVERATERVDGARLRRPRRSIDVELSGSSAAVSLRLAARYGTVLPELAEAVQRHVSGALEAMCGLEARNVNVLVEELVER
jgi:uncharacterized alkaline shock family protein YloU